MFNKIPSYIRKLDWEWKWKRKFQMFSDPSLENLKQEVVEAKILEVILWGWQSFAGLASICIYWHLQLQTPEILRMSCLFVGFKYANTILMIVTIRYPGLLFAHILVFPNFSQDLTAQNQLTCEGSNARILKSTAANFWHVSSYLNYLIFINTRLFELFLEYSKCVSWMEWMRWWDKRKHFGERGKWTRKDIYHLMLAQHPNHTYFLYFLIF